MTQKKRFKRLAVLKIKVSKFENSLPKQHQNEDLLRPKMLAFTCYFMHLFEFIGQG